MHSKQIEIDGLKYAVHHNSDWSGDAFIVWKGRDGVHNEVHLPGKLLLRCAKDAAFDAVISAIEQART